MDASPSITPTVRCCCLAVHPAHYQRPAYQAVQARGAVELHVRYLFGRTELHPYCEPFDLRFPAEAVLECPGARHPLVHDYPDLRELLADYDVIAVAGYAHSTTKRAIWLATRMRKPVVLIADSTLAGNRRLWSRAGKRVLLPLFTRSLGAIWVPGAAGRAYWQHYGVPAQKIFEGAYCLPVTDVTESMSSCLPRRSAIRAAIGLLELDFAFLFVGRLVDQRGLQYLVRAFQQVQPQCPQAALMLVGNGPWKDRLERCCGKEGIKKVFIIPPVPWRELTQYYVAADAYVQSSVYEPYSLSTAQAAIASLPIITTDVVGAGDDYVQEGVSGLRVPAADSDALARAMRAVCGNPASARAMGRRAAAVAIGRSTGWASRQLESAILCAFRSAPS